MTDQVELFGFDTSNNMKARVAAGFKGIPYEWNAIDPSDRDGLVQMSNQYLSPVLRHGGTVLFDSAAILRYFEANFPATPRLFGNSRDEQWEIEDWEFMARTRLAGPMLRVVHARVSGHPLSDADEAANGAEFRRVTSELAERLNDRQWLIGDTMTAADVSAAAVVFRVRSGEIFELDESADRIADWVERVMSFDGKHRIDVS